MIKTAKQVLAKPFTSNFFFIFLQGIMIGMITGLIVGTFRWIIDHTMKFLFFIYPLMRQKPIYLIPYVIATLLIVFILGQVIKPVLNNITGSGVPQVEAVMLNENKMNWWSILWRKYVGGLLAICPGLFLGREGPCIQMGAMVGQAFGENLFHADPDDLKRLQGCGIAAGLSAAFSAPLAGVFFLVEEITFNFTPKEVLTALAAAMSSDLMTLFFFGTQPCLYLPLEKSLPLTSYWFVTIMGVALGLLAHLYQYCLLSLKPVYSKLTKIPKIYHSIIPLLLVIPIGLWNATLLGGSHDFISSLFEPIFMKNIQTGTLSLMLLPLIWFIVRFIFSMISYGASVPGGIFMPILVLGALLGVIFAVIMIHFNIAPKRCYGIIIVTSMCAYFGAIEKAPFTALTLLTEMVGSVEQIFPMLITTFIAYFVLDLLGGKPIYAALRIQMNYHKLSNLPEVKHAEE
ncbi:chloride transporter, ClC family [Lactobacillus taiwanensis DSM 21401]|jgi:Chloride channel protein EriC|uniref:ClC family H(+)/Cl(-) exchange transporter n=1 Tax=Lactobacillus johnsonii TaxID=33959 RepID=A0A9W3YZW2_LACJH|nr:MULTISPECIES: ClC family H(+)/Cl(-) exchange transporter [Lactobacillus]MDY4730276.1 ClC family H(+)/Cl(-) exchange transporter [Lactobacillus amylovorus]AZZ66969.1 ClC family H(+)/Cl(-) exchange transporter [Lactobacillus johnsonii]KRN00466.1 chloride transporter, ClC family [Lactobacillus taiwanensis DSM 21401]MCI6229480.1 ClC family H(+)/Cl(-) exchange transporter [Lactobacillus johnsonii]MCI6882021.1 ClC family H(+)/Cl(-) exchange transporter [Lactobacillus johnsonii]